MIDLRQRVHDAQALFHSLNGILGELPKRAARVERGEVTEIPHVLELVIALDRLAQIGAGLGVPDAERLRLACLAILCACEDIGGTSRSEHSPEVTP